MTERIEQSPRNGHDDPRPTRRLHVVTASLLLPDVPEESTSTPPTLTLVGGTDFTPTGLEPIARS